jgi:hypothetical protein
VGFYIKNKYDVIWIIWNFWEQWQIAHFWPILQTIKKYVWISIEQSTIQSNLTKKRLAKTVKNLMIFFVHFFFHFFGNQLKKITCVACITILNWFFVSQPFPWIWTFRHLEARPSPIVGQNIHICRSLDI